MSSVEFMREFVNQRLTAAADDIFRVFNSTVVRYEEEISRQRRLLDLRWKPELRLNRIELPPQHGCREEEEEEDEVPADQELQDQEMQTSLDPEPPQIKEEEEEEFWSTPDGPVVLKAETDSFVLASVYTGSECSLDQQDPEPLQVKEEEEEPCTSQEAEQLELKQETDSFILSSVCEDSEPEPDPQLLLHTSDVTADEEPRPGEEHQEGAYIPLIGKKSVQCEICGKAFKYKSKMKTHLRIHAGKRHFISHTCGTCGKEFRFIQHLKVHMRRDHAEEKCRPSFKQFLGCRSSNSLERQSFNSGPEGR